MIGKSMEMKAWGGNVWEALGEHFGAKKMPMCVKRRVKKSLDGQVGARVFWKMSRWLVIYDTITLSMNEFMRRWVH